MRICKICATDISHTFPTRTTCSQACQFKAESTKVLECPCGAKLVVHRANKRKYCGFDCPLYKKAEKSAPAMELKLCQCGGLFQPNIKSQT